MDRAARPALKVAAFTPVDLEEALHCFAHAFVTEDDGSPGGPGDYRIKESDHAFFGVEDGELHRQAAGDAHLDARSDIFIEALTVVAIEGAGFQQQPAG